MSLTNSLLRTLMPLATLNYNSMDTLDKYRSIIDKIQEMCTSTVALAPYPVGGISVTTIKNKQRKGKSSKPMLNYKYTKQWNERSTSIVETMEEIAKLCEAITNTKEFREFYNDYKNRVAENKKRIEKKGSQKAIDNILGTIKKWKETAKGNKPINCSYISEGGADPEYTIPRGNVKRVQNNMNRYTNRALDRNPDAKYMQKEAVANFVRMMKAKVGSRRKKLSPEELEAVKNIYKFAPANMDPEESEKYQRAIEQKKKYKEYMRAVKNKRKSR